VAGNVQGAVGSARRVSALDRNRAPHSYFLLALALCDMSIPILDSAQKRERKRPRKRKDSLHLDPTTAASAAATQDPETEPAALAEEPLAEVSFEARQEGKKTSRQALLDAPNNHVLTVDAVTARKEKKKQRKPEPSELVAGVAASDSTHAEQPIIESQTLPAATSTKTKGRKVQFSDAGEASTHILESAASKKEKNRKSKVEVASEPLDEEAPVKERRKKRKVESSQDPPDAQQTTKKRRSGAKSDYADPSKDPQISEQAKTGMLIREPYRR
jgi:hypothetical protein